MRAAAGLAAVLTSQDDLGGPPAVVIGYDARHKSDVFAAGHRGGAQRRGRDRAAACRVRCRRRSSRTPYGTSAAAAGVMVTASHNPPRDNGYKVYWGDGAQIIPPLDAEISAAIDAVGPGGRAAARRRLDTCWTTRSWRPTCARCRGCRSATPATSRSPTRRCTGSAATCCGGRSSGAGSRRRTSWPSRPSPTRTSRPSPSPTRRSPAPWTWRSPSARAADLVIANDPDADRCAVAVRPAARMLTGDEVGGLLAEHVLRHTDGRRPARRHHDRVLVAARQDRAGARRAVRRDAHRLQMDHEGRLRPATGSCTATRRRSATASAATTGCPYATRTASARRSPWPALAAEAKAEGRTLLDLLDDQARRYGLHATAQLSVRVDGPVADHGRDGAAAGRPAGRARPGRTVDRGRRPGRRRRRPAAHRRPAVPPVRRRTGRRPAVRHRAQAQVLPGGRGPGDRLGRGRPVRRPPPSWSPCARPSPGCWGSSRDSAVASGNMPRICHTN